jgi:hypothetical protein
MGTYVYLFEMNYDRLLIYTYVNGHTFAIEPVWG